jgi:ATP-dependent DNA helicase RecQ
MLLYRAEDVALQRFFASGAPPETQIRDLVAVVRQRPRDLTELAQVSGLRLRKLSRLVTLLTEVGAILPDPEGRLYSPAGAPVPVQAARLALAEVERHATVQRTRIDMMRQFAETRACRGQALLAYFGDRLGVPCGHCDNCAAGTVAPAPVLAESYPLHTVVRHADWGTGTVLGHENDRITVLFDSVGYKTLSAGLVRKQNLMIPASNVDTRAMPAANREP